MRSPELEVLLSSGFHVHWSVLALQVLSMDPLILLWVSGTMEEEASGACGRRCRLEQSSIFNLWNQTQEITLPCLPAARATYQNQLCRLS